MARGPTFYEGMVIESTTGGPDLIRRGNSWVPIDAVNAAGKMAPQEQKAIEDARGASSNAIDVLGDLTRFQDINAKTGTGGITRFPGVKTVRNIFDPQFQQLGEISARLTPAQRTPGSGTTSDRDLALYAQAVPGVDRDPKANNAIIERSRAEAVRRQQYADFLDEYARKNGTLNGAEKAFRGMIGLGTEQNPYKADQAGDRSQLPRGAYYDSPEGMRRNDNGSRGNPIIRPRTASSGSQPVRVKTAEEAMRLSPGTVFLTPDGRRKVR